MKKKDKLSSELDKVSKLTNRNSKLSNRCAYCGIYADTRDHVIPVSFMYNNRPDNYKHQYLINNIVTACRECNSLASNKVFDNFIEKKKYLTGKIEERYKNLINYPKWEKEELEELEGYLKRSVENSIQAQEFIKMRIEHLKNTLI